MIIKMNDIAKVKDFYDGVMNENRVMIVRFCAEWSGSCHIMKPIFKEMSMVYGNLASFYEIDADRFPELQSELGITEIPTILVYKKGTLVAFLAGLISRDALNEKLKNVLA